MVIHSELLYLVLSLEPKSECGSLHLKMLPLVLHPLRELLEPFLAADAGLKDGQHSISIVS